MARMIIRKAPLSLRNKFPSIKLAGLPQRDESFQELFHAVELGLHEAASHIFRRGR